MENENPLTPEDRALEASLARLRPVRTGIDRDRLMFEAGRRLPPCWPSP